LTDIKTYTKKTAVLLHKKNSCSFFFANKRVDF